MRSFCRPARSATILPLSPNLCSALILSACHSQLFKEDDEPRSPMAINPPQLGPPIRRELAPRHGPLIFDREALRAPAH